MNYSLAREIYGNQPWAVESSSFKSLLGLLSDFRAGVSFAGTEEKLNSLHLYDPKAAVKIVTETYELSTDTNGDQLVYVINLNGVITKSGGMSSYGMKELAAKMLRFDADSRIVGGIIVTDSGGGSSLGMELMQYTVNNCTKPVVGFIERAGMAASAAYGILSQTDYIMAEDKGSQVGSIGTMISFSGHPNGTIDGDNAKQVTIYATASTQKNKAYEEAINNDNYKLLVDEILDPVNNRFLDSVKAKRPNVKPTELDGSMYDAGNVIGSLVDQIGSFDDAVQKVISLSKIPKAGPSNSKILNNKNKNAMTAQQLKSEHPETYNEIFGAGLTKGIASEKDRVGSWMAHSDTDLASVKAGIESGGEITSTAREIFFVKASSAKKLEDLKVESPVAVVVPEATGAAVEELTEAEAFYANLLKGDN